MEQFILRKLSDVGTSNPIVARLAIQTNRLLQPFIQDKKMSDDIYEVLGVMVKDRLIACYKIYSSILAEIMRIDCDINEGIIDLTPKPNLFIEVPTIIDLKEKCENFLYQAKSSLRDLCVLFRLFFGENFEEPRFDKIYEWTCEEFGCDDELTKMIKNEHDAWIRRVISMRNAVEHPGGRSGTIFIKNVELAINSKLKSPVWGLNNEPGSSVIGDMNTFINNMLFLSEDLLMMCLEKFNSSHNLPITFREIPEEDRDISCPIRIELGIKDEYYKDIPK